jgi:hypothetical protein
MRTFIYLIVASFLCCACKKSDDSISEEVIQLDTLYDGDFIWREKMKSKRLTIIMDNGIDKQKPVFKINKETLLRIRIPRLTKYEIFPSEIHGADIVKVDTAINIFLVTPTDSSFQFVLNQYYPRGRVVRYRKTGGMKRMILKKL